MDLQTKITELSNAVAIKKVAHVVTKNGNIAIKEFYVGKQLYTGTYENGEVIIKDQKGKRINAVVVNVIENKKADKKKPQNDKAAPDMPDADI